MKLLCALLVAAAPLGAGTAASVEIDASKAGRQIQPELFSQNWNTYEKSGDGSDPAYNAALKAMGATQLRIPGGGYASMRAWDDITCGGKDAGWLVDLQGAIKFAEASGVQLMPIVNFGGFWCDKEHGYDEAIKKAAAWVKHMNVEPRAHTAKYWEIGNEIYYERDKAHTDGKTYGLQYARFHKAMKAVDPAIKLGFNLFEDREPKKLAWNTAALKALKSTGVWPDWWAVHSYPIWMPKEARKASGAPDWNKEWYADNPKMDQEIFKNVATAARFTRELDQTIAEVLGKDKVGKSPYFLTEFRSVLELKYIEFVDAIYCAEYLLELGRNGWLGSNIWALKNGYDKASQADFGLLRTGANKDADDNPKNSPRPTWYIFPYLSRVFGRQLVEAQGGSELVKAWASKDSNGNLTVFLTNRGAEEKESAKVTLNLKGFNAGAAAEAWLLESAGTDVHGKSTPILHRRDIKVNGVLRPSPTKLPAARKVKAGPATVVDMPAASMLLLRFSPAR